jgi:hypothetical protein
MIHALWIVPLVLLIVFLASPRFRGDIAQTRVRRILSAGLEKSRYTVLNDVTLASGGGTVHIDHLVIARFGIFVIESQYTRGWVSGGEFQARWKQRHWGRSALFDNPAHRNVVQVEALSRLLDYPSRAFHPMVVLVGQKGFKTRMPAHVLPAEQLISAIRKKGQPLLDAEQADRALTTIDAARVRTTGWGSAGKLSLVRFALVVLLVAGAWVAFSDQVIELTQKMQEQSARETTPELFRSDGTRKTERELWEDSLVCAYSVDSGRCACYEPDGTKAEMTNSECRKLAERGSILNR